MEFSVRVSFLELYNEELFDLLGSTEEALRLKIYEDSTKKVISSFNNKELFDLLGSTEEALRLKIYEDSTKKVTLHV